MSILSFKDLPSSKRHIVKSRAKRMSGTNPAIHAQQHSGIQAIILAAGRGRRLEDAIKGRSKCLATVNGHRLIDLQLSALSRAGIDEVCIVTGYQADAVKAVVGDRAQFLHNPNWSSSNSLYSLSLCRDWVRSPVVILNCDVLAHPDVLTRLIRQGQCTFAYDSTSGSDNEHMKVELEDGRLQAMSKALPYQLTSGENVGLLYFSSKAMRLLFDQAEYLVRTGGKNLWLASAVERVAKRLPLHGVDVSDLPWIEIDYEHDLTRARRWVGPAIQTAVAPLNVALAGAVI